MRLCDRMTVRREGAFTMVEIALSIAVVAFALVAILGVLPTGMSVQKDNRDDGVINQEGRYWMEAIRSGAQGLDDITNYVESITVTNLTRPAKTVTFDNRVGGSASILSPADIIALLSTPKYQDTGSGSETNRVLARVKAITGPASEKGPLTNEYSFRYELQVEITGGKPLPDGFAASQSTNVVVYNETLGNNLQEVRLILRWPVVQRGNGWLVGNGRKTFRARIAGRYTFETNHTAQVATRFRNTTGRDLAIITPNRFHVAGD
jgi:type II secretory pathway pseudopilin PulG